MSPTQRHYVLRETMIAVIVSCGISAGFALLVVKGRAALPLLGAGGIAFDFVPQTFMLTLATVLAITLTTRGRLRKGVISPLPLSEAGPLARIPGHVLVRALLIATLATVVFSPWATGMFVAAGITSLSAQSFVAMKALYGAALTVLLGFPVTRAALLQPMGKSPRTELAGIVPATLAPAESMRGSDERSVTPFGDAEAPPMARQTDPDAKIYSRGSSLAAKP